MKKRKYIYTQFVKYLIESEKQKKENDEVEEVKPDDIETDEVFQDDLDADEIIERLIQKLKNSSKEYDDIIYGRK